MAAVRDMKDAHEIYLVTIALFFLSGGHFLNSL